MLPETARAARSTVAHPTRHAMTDKAPSPLHAFAIDLRALAVFRVALALALLADVATRLADWRAFFTDDGPWPASAAAASAAPSLLSFSTSERWMALLVAAQCVSAVALALGWKTRAATIASWALLVSVQSRNALILHGGDLELRLLLFWSMALPLGAKGSLDARRTPASNTAVRSVASAVLLAQVAMIYVTSALLKTDAAWWSTGEAVRDALSLRSYTRPLADTLLRWPGALRWVTRATFALELIGPLIAFSPWRRARCRLAVALAFMAFHLGLSLTLRLGLFPLVGAIGWVPFLPLGPSPRALAPSASRAVSVVVASLFALSLMCVTRPWAPRLPPAPLYAIARTLRLDQRWDLFAPRPLQHDGWFVVVGVTRDGRELDLATGRAPAWTPPRPLRSLYPTVRWRRYDASLRRGRVDALRELVAWRLREARGRWGVSDFARVTVVRVTVATRPPHEVSSEDVYSWPEASPRGR